MSCPWKKTKNYSSVWTQTGTTSRKEMPHDLVSALIFFLPTLPLRFKDPIRVDQCVQWLLIVAIRKQCVKFKRKTKKLFSVMPIWGNSSGEDNWVLTKEDEKQIQHARPLSNLFCHLEVLILLFTDQIIGPLLDEKTNINYYLEYLIGAKLPSVFCCRLRGPDPVVTSTP